MAAYTQGIESERTKCEVWSDPSNLDKSVSLVYCEAILEVHNLSGSRVILLQKCPFCPFFLSFFFVSHNLLTKAYKNTPKNHHNSSFCTMYMPFDTYVLIHQAILHWLQQQINTLSNKCSIHDTIFIHQAYHADDSPKVHNSNMMNITTQSKIPSFVCSQVSSKLHTC